jgi:hypothetical protein
MEKQGIMIFNFVKSNIKKIKPGLTILLLSVFLLESSCSAAYKTHKRYQQVPCPCMKNHR